MLCYVSGLFFYNMIIYISPIISIIYNSVPIIILIVLCSLLFGSSVVSVSVVFVYIISGSVTCLIFSTDSK